MMTKEGTDKAPLIARYLDMGRTQDEICHLCDCSLHSIQKVKIARQSHAPLPEIIAQRFHKVITPELEKYIVNQTILCPRESDESLAQRISQTFGVSLCRSTVNRYRHYAHFAYKDPRRCQLLTDRHKELRLQFARSMLSSGIDLGTVIFSDESRFVFHDDSGLLWRRYGEVNPQTTLEQTKFDAGIMIYAAIGTNYKSNLVFVEDSVNTVQYWLNIEASGMLQARDPHSYIFMQDGAPAHMAKRSTEYFSTRCNLLCHWPANSPDCNPIEMVWAEMKRIVREWMRQQGPDAHISKEQLRKAIQDAYDALPMSYINALVSSFSKRLKLVIAHEGESINAFFHQQPPEPSLNLIAAPSIWRADELVAKCDPTKPHVQSAPRLARLAADFGDQNLSNRRAWTPEEDNELRDAYSKCGAKWTSISKIFVNRSAIACKNRFTKLCQQKKEENEKIVQKYHAYVQAGVINPNTPIPPPPPLPDTLVAPVLHPAVPMAVPAPLHVGQV